MNERPSYLTWMFGFLAGGLAGAGAALLLAPSSGQASRGRIGRQLRYSAGSIRALKDRVARRGAEIRAAAYRGLEEDTSARAPRAGRRSAGKGADEAASPSP
jgi:gas vesicle protein